ncbi:MAG: NAD(+) diphosphatase [Marmoricola sp.]
MARLEEPPQIALGEPPYDRVAERRTDRDWLDRAWRSPGTRVLAVAGNRVQGSPDGLRWRSPDEAPDGLRVLLGEERGVVSFAVLADRGLADRVLADDDSWQPLRSLMLLLPAADATYAVHAVGLAEWHRSVRHCPRCGAVLEPRRSGHVLTCPACGREQFPRTDPAVIMLITDQDDRALLGRQPSWPTGRWSTLAGFVEPGESVEQAVRREVLEESGVRVGPVSYFGSQPWPFPASLMLGFCGRADRTRIAVDGHELEQARWFSRADALAAAEAGSLVIPPGISISRSLITHWYGDDLPGAWR